MNASLRHATPMAQTTLPPLRGALFFAAAAGCGVAAVYAAARPWGLGGEAVAGALWLLLGAYTLLLCRWTGAQAGKTFLPLAIPLAVAMTAAAAPPFVAAWVLVLAWVRSGLCQRGPLLRRVMAESLLCLAAGWAIAALLWTGSDLVAAASLPRALQLGLGVWLFFLLQTLYFLFFEQTAPQQDRNAAFERAKRRAEAILASGAP